MIINFKNVVCVIIILCFYINIFCFFHVSNMDNDFFTSTFETNDQSLDYNDNIQMNSNVPNLNREVNVWTGRFEDEVPLLEGKLEIDKK